MGSKVCFFTAAVVLVLTARLPAQVEEEVAGNGLALLKVPVSASLEQPDQFEELGAERVLELRALPGELLLARLGLRHRSAAAIAELSVAFEGEESAWVRDASFAAGSTSGDGSLQTAWLTMFVPEDAAPGVYEGYLVARAGGEQLRTPLVVTISSGRLRPSPTRYLVLSSAPTPGPASQQAMPEGIPPVWPLELPLTVTSVEEQNGHVSLDFSRLEALVDELPEGAASQQPLPVFLAPLMRRLCDQFGVEPLSATYVLALHSLLAQLRDWAAERDVALVFVPPSSDPDDDPDGLALEQHLFVLLETPAVRVLLPMEPLLELSRSPQRRLLSLAHAYLVESSRAVKLVERRGREQAGRWLRVSVGRRLEAGLWARLVGAEVVLAWGQVGPDARLWAACAQTDARYLDTVNGLLEQARESSDPATQRVAQQAEELLKDLRREVEKALTERSAQTAMTDDDLDVWRGALRHHITQLERLLQ